MKKYAILLPFLFVQVIYSMEALSAQQTTLLNPLISSYKNLEIPDRDDVASFLEPYDKGVTLQRVFSNPQKGALCGVYMLQNALWYYYKIAQQKNSKVLKETNHKFAHMLNDIKDVGNSPLNGIEVESLETLAQDNNLYGYPDNHTFAIVASEGNQYVLKNLSYLEVYNTLKDYMKKVKENMTPVVSFFVACGENSVGGSAYDSDNLMNGIATHWVSLTRLSQG